MSSCDSCQCPAAPGRWHCAFCGSPFEQRDPVTFSLERRGNGFRWVTDGSLVASASRVDGLWQLHDARGEHVVTLVPFGDGPGIALVGPGARLLGRIRPGEEMSGAGGSVATDSESRPVLVLRNDGTHGAHLADRHGEVVAIASWEDADAATDLLVTPHGTGQSLALVFGLLLSLELERHAGRAA